MGVPGFIGRELARMVTFKAKLPMAPKLHEVGKTIAKHGIEGIKQKEKLNGFERNLVDKRVGHLVQPDFKLNVKEAISELPNDKHLRYEYLSTLLNKVHRKDDVRAIINYVKSAAAGNLTPDQRAHLLITALEKLKYIDIVAQFFH
jgi:hypothetical protein